MIVENSWPKNEPRLQEDIVALQIQDGPTLSVRDRVVVIPVRKVLDMLSRHDGATIEKIPECVLMNLTVGGTDES